MTSGQIRTNSATWPRILDTSQRCESIDGLWKNGCSAPTIGAGRWSRKQFISMRFTTNVRREDVGVTNATFQRNVELMRQWTREKPMRTELRKSEVAGTWSFLTNELVVIGVDTSRGSGIGYFCATGHRPECAEPLRHGAICSTILLRRHRRIEVGGASPGATIRCREAVTDRSGLRRL
jgi:hypothetical protein